MSVNYIFSVPDKKLEEINKVRKTCDRYGISFSNIVIEGIKKEIHSKKWMELFKNE